MQATCEECGSGIARGREWTETSYEFNATDAVSAEACRGRLNKARPARYFCGPCAWSRGVEEESRARLFEEHCEARAGRDWALANPSPEARARRAERSRCVGLITRARARFPDRPLVLGVLDALAEDVLGLPAQGAPTQGAPAPE
jgi:hypothetical protein